MSKRRRHPRGARGRSARMTIMALTMMGVTVLAACSPAPSPTLTPDGSPGPESSEAIFLANGTAEDNLPFFAAVTAQVRAAGERDSGRAYIDALVTAGFDRAEMQVTEDVTTVGNSAETMLFSVRWGEDDCLVGQIGPSTGEPVTAVVDQLAEGRCLIGKTRPIDW